MAMTQQAGRPHPRFCCSFVRCCGDGEWVVNITDDMVVELTVALMTPSALPHSTRNGSSFAGLVIAHHSPPPALPPPPHHYHLLHSGYGVHTTVDYTVVNTTFTLRAAWFVLPVRDCVVLVLPAKLPHPPATYFLHSLMCCDQPSLLNYRPVDGRDRHDVSPPPSI